MVLPGITRIAQQLSLVSNNINLVNLQLRRTEGNVTNLNYRATNIQNNIQRIDIVDVPGLQRRITEIQVLTEELQRTFTEFIETANAELIEIKQLIQTLKSTVDQIDINIEELAEATADNRNRLIRIRRIVGRIDTIVGDIQTKVNTINNKVDAISQKQDEFSRELQDAKTEIVETVQGVENALGDLVRQEASSNRTTIVESKDELKALLQPSLEIIQSATETLLEEVNGLAAALAETQTAILGAVGAVAAETTLILGATGEIAASIVFTRSFLRNEIKYSERQLSNQLKILSKDFKNDLKSALDDFAKKFKKQLEDFQKEIKEELEKLPEKTSNDVTMKIVGESWFRFDSTSAFYPTVIFKFRERNLGLIPKVSQIKLRLKKKNQELTDADIVRLKEKCARLKGLNYDYGQVRGNYVSADKRFKTIVFSTAEQSIIELLKALMEAIDEQFDLNCLSFTTARNRENSTKRAAPLAGVSVNTLSYTVVLNQQLNRILLLVNGLESPILIFENKDN